MKNKLMLFLALLGITSTAVTQDVNAARRKKKSRRNNPDDTPVSLSKEEIKTLVTLENMKKALVDLKAEDLKSVDVKGLVKEFFKVRSGSGDAIDTLFSGKTDAQKKEWAEKIFKAYQEAVAFYTENDINLATSLYAEKAAEMNDKFKNFSAKVEGYDTDEIESEYTKLVDQFKKEFDSISDKKKQKFLNSLLELYVSVSPAGQDLKSMKRVIREQDRLLSQIKEYQAGPGELKGVCCALDAIEKNIKKVVTAAGISAEDQEKLQKILETYKKSEVQSGKKSSNEYLNAVLDTLEVDQTKSGNWAQKIRNIFAIAEDESTPISGIIEKIEAKNEIKTYINQEKWNALKDKISADAKLDQLLAMLPDNINARVKNQAKSKLRKLAEQKLSAAELVTKINGDQELRELFDDTKWGAFEGKVAGGTPIIPTNPIPGNPIPTNPTTTELTKTIVQELVNVVRKKLIPNDKKAYEEFEKDAKHIRKDLNGSVEDLIERMERNGWHKLFRKDEYAAFKAKYGIV